MSLRKPIAPTTTDPMAKKKDPFTTFAPTEAARSKILVDLPTDLKVELVRIAATQRLSMNQTAVVAIRLLVSTMAKKK